MNVTTLWRKPSVKCIRTQIYSGINSRAFSFPVWEFGFLDLIKKERKVSEYDLCFKFVHLWPIKRIIKEFAFSVLNQWEHQCLVIYWYKPSVVEKQQHSGCYTIRHDTISLWEQSSRFVILRYVYNLRNMYRFGIGEVKGGLQQLDDAWESRPLFETPHPAVLHQIIPERIKYQCFKRLLQRLSDVTCVKDEWAGLV